MKSMTGFGKGIAENARYQVEAEIKSVNHRFLDIQLRGSKQLNQFENQLRQLIKRYLQRGRVEVFLTVTEKDDTAKKVTVHWELVDQLVTQLQTEAKSRYGETDLSVNRLLEQVVVLPDFVAVEQTQVVDDSLWEVASAAVTEAARLNELSREKEGQGIAQVLRQQQQELVALVTKLGAFNTVYEKDYQARFEQKLQNYLGESVDQERLLTEMALLLERGDIHEELDRLMIHLNNLNELLATEKPVGRELDFLIQEINREINTVGSKSSPIEIKEFVVQMKTTVEKIREQVQNIE